MKIVLTQGFTANLEVVILNEGELPIKQVYNTFQGIGPAQELIQEHIDATDDYEIITRGNTKSIQTLVKHFSLEKMAEEPEQKLEEKNILKQDLYNELENDVDTRTEKREVEIKWPWS